MTNHPRPWHRGSAFGGGPRRPLNRDERARFTYLLRAHRRARRLTPLAEHVGMTLLQRLGTDGRCDPSHRCVASDVGCSERTVQRATDTMRSLGLLTWQRRLVRQGWRTSQTSNAYLLCPVAIPPVISCDRQNGRPTVKKDYMTAAAPLPPPSASEVAVAHAALARRRAAIEGRLLGNRR
jgi:hypothetical protein